MLNATSAYSPVTNAAMRSMTANVFSFPGGAAHPPDTPPVQKTRPPHAPTPTPPPARPPWTPRRAVVPQREHHRERPDHDASRLAVIKLGEPGPYAYEIDLDFCKGCGICVAECPCGAIEMVPETI